jgi:hypothetical protein
VQIGVIIMSSLVGSWTEHRITAACTFIRDRLEADFAGTDLPTIEFRIDPTWSDPSAIRSSPEPRPEDVIVVCGGHEFPLRLDSGVEWACSEAAFQLQDDVMGEHNRPWPDLYDSERYVGVLVPSADAPGGIAQWRLDDETFCAIGHLHQASGAAGLTIKALT